MAKPLTTNEAAKRLGISRARVLHLIAAGRLRAEKFGNAYSIAVASLAAVKDRKPGRPKKLGK